MIRATLVQIQNDTHWLLDEGPARSVRLVTAMYLGGSRHARDKLLRRVRTDDGRRWLFQDAAYGHLYELVLTVQPGRREPMECLLP
jgi:hypothetical protein